MESDERKVVAGVFGFIVIFLLFIGMIFSIKIIPTGHIGVRHVFGKVTGNPLVAGLNLKNPLARVQVYSIRTEEYTMISAIGEGAIEGADTISAKTKENTEVGLDITVLYRLNDEKVIEIWKTIGTEGDIIAKLIRPPIRTKVRDIVALYTKDELNQQRPAIAVEIEDAIKENVKGRGIIIEQVFLRDIKFPLEVQNAINDKEAEKERAEKMVFTIDKEKREAERKRVEAQGIADANAIIDRTLSREYLTYYWITNLKEHESVLYVPVGDAGMPLFKEVDNYDISDEVS